MKSLTKMQLNALSSKIYVEIIDFVNNYNDSLITDEGLKEWKENNPIIVRDIKYAIQGCKFWNDVNPDYSVRNVANKEPEKEYSILYKKSLEFLSFPSRESIENDIVLETIKSDNLDEIIEKIKNKYLLNN